MLKILVADDNRDFCHLIGDFLATQDEMEYVGCVNDGTEVVSALEKYHPTVLLLDLVMPHQDGIEVLEELTTSTTPRPKIIVMSAFGQDNFVAKANQLGVDYYLMKPFSLATLVKRIKQIVNIGSPHDFHQERQRQQINDRILQYFSSIGVPPHYKGYRYLVEAITLVCIDKTWINGITKRLYPRVGSKFGTSAVQVERAIRHAVEVTWEKGDLTQLNRLFPYTVDSEKGKPTNSSFIAKMADIISLDIK